MFVGAFEYYLIGVNIIGFFLYLINMWLYSHTAEGQIDKFLTILSLLGGSLGILLAIVIFDRKAVKDNMMPRVFISCVFVIQVDGKRSSCGSYNTCILDLLQSIQDSADISRNYKFCYIRDICCQ